jgi:uncharacterized protein YbjT (DUF2867 family)
MDGEAVREARLKGVGIMELVVGATGQVGSAVVEQLSERGIPVRAFVRGDARSAHLRDLPHVELAIGDLLDPTSVRWAVDGCDHVIATANGALPRKRGDHARVERVGYPTLIDAARDAGVERFVYLSQPMPEGQDLPMQRDKRAVERSLQASGLEYTILRPGAMMESWLAFPGSELPTRGEPVATVHRDFWFIRAYRRATHRTIDRHGVMMVNGGPDRKLSFISVQDVASLLIAATTHDLARNADLLVGGPEVLSWGEVAELYGQVLGREVVVRPSPVTPLKVMSGLLAPFSPAASNILALNVAAAAADMVPPPDVAAALGVGPMKRVETFLKEKAALPEGS